MINGIPKIIHQIWWQGKNNIPKTYPNYSESWKTKNKKFKYVFWDGKAIKNLIAQHYPHLLKKFNSYSKMINKIDIAKLIILHRYGGVYVDIDSECLKPIEDLLTNKKVILAQISVNILEKYVVFRKWSGYALQNGFMAGEKNHPFWKHCLNTIFSGKSKKRPFETELMYVFRITGPSILTEAYHTYPNKRSITVLSNSKIDPISWCDYEVYNCANQQCQNRYPNAYSIHHYGSKHKTHNWNNNIEKIIGIYLCTHKTTLVYMCCLMIVLAILVIYNYVVQ